MQHCKIMSVGDASKDEARQYFEKHLLPEVPENLQGRITFDELYPVFGGKLAHISDYIADYVNTDGKLSRRCLVVSRDSHQLITRNLQLPNPHTMLKHMPCLIYNLYMHLRRCLRRRQRTQKVSLPALVYILRFDLSNLLPMVRFKRRLVTTSLRRTCWLSVGGY